MYHYGIDVDILVNGKPIKKHAHAGRVYVEAKHWTEYSIKIRNNNWSRRLVVVSVDGINVIDGLAAGSTQAGYVINGYSSTEIKGFRTSNQEVHPFKFNAQERSYAAKSEETQGDTSNCGVIGVQVYDEKEKPLPVIKIREIIREVPSYPQPTWTVWGNGITGGATTYGTTTASPNVVTCGCQNASYQLDAAPDMECCTRGMSAGLTREEPKRGFDMGTEFSSYSVEDKVVDVEFETGNLLTTIEIYYASNFGLKSMGVPIVKQTQITMPSAFPSRFCKPPR